MRRTVTLLLILALLTGILSGCNDTGVSNSLRKEIQEAYRKEFLSAWERNKYEFKNEDADTVAGIQYYGTYNGYVILMQPGMLTVISGVQIGPCSFQWGSGPVNLYAYQDGTFHALKDVYEAGEITDEEIRTIAQAHKAYFRKHHNWDYDIEVEI